MRFVARSPPGGPALRPSISGAVSISTIERSSEAEGGTTAVRPSAAVDVRSSTQARSSVAGRRIIRRILPRVPLGHLLIGSHGDDPAARDAHQLIGRQAEYGVRMTTRGPDRLPREQVFAGQRRQRRGGGIGEAPGGG